MTHLCTCRQVTAPLGRVPSLNERLRALSSCDRDVAGDVDEEVRVGPSAGEELSMTQPLLTPQEDRGPPGWRTSHRFDQGNPLSQFPPFPEEKGQEKG